MRIVFHQVLLREYDALILAVKQAAARKEHQERASAAALIQAFEQGRLSRIRVRLAPEGWKIAALSEGPHPSAHTTLTPRGAV